MASPWSDDAIRQCPLGRWDGTPGNCRWCNTPLTGRQRRWCRPCGLPGGGYAAHHDWGSARAAALTRDGHRCVSCGATAPETPEGAHRLLGLLLAPVDLPGVTDLQSHLKAYFPWVLREIEPDRYRFVVDRQTIHVRQWHALIAAEKAICRAGRLEVDHIEPIRGRHNEVGCHHHLDGLRTLCHPCHVAVTAEQFGYRTSTPDRQHQLNLTGAA